MAEASAGSMALRATSNFGLTLELPASEAVPVFNNHSDLSLEQAEVRSFCCRTRQ